MTHRNRLRASSFGEDAERYDRARPSYPDALVDDLVGPDVVRVLDVGCGTGIAGRLFAARGCRVTGVEPDARMASVARRRGLDVEVASFEEWRPPERPFDLVIAAQSWHWVDPEVGPRQVAAVLRDGATFAAFWNRYSHDPEVRQALDVIYSRHAPQITVGSVALGTLQDAAAPGLEASGCFDRVEWRSYPWERVRSTEEWIDELPTHSDHRTLPPEVLAAVLTDVRDALDRLGGSITVHGRTRVVTAVARHRRPPAR